jgi:hypothetical protein
MTLNLLFLVALVQSAQLLSVRVVDVSFQALPGTDVQVTQVTDCASRKALNKDKTFFVPSWLPLSACSASSALIVVTSA